MRTIKLDRFCLYQMEFESCTTSIGASNACVTVYERGRPNARKLARIKVDKEWNIAEVKFYPDYQKGALRPKHAAHFKLKYYLTTGRVPDQLTWEVLLVRAKASKGKGGEVRALNEIIKGLNDARV